MGSPTFYDSQNGGEMSFTFYDNDFTTSCLIMGPPLDGLHNTITSELYYYQYQYLQQVLQILCHCADIMPF